MVNSGGFEAWNSWQKNIDSPESKKMKESRQPFEGFTFEEEDYELAE